MWVVLLIPTAWILSKDDLCSMKDERLQELWKQAWKSRQLVCIIANSNILTQIIQNT